MIEFLNKDVVDRNHGWKRVPDTVENILDDMADFTLDPRFESYGDFVDRSPKWLNPETAEKYKGCASIFGNFLEYSHAFRLVTDDEEIIRRIEEAVARNKATVEYQEALERIGR
jgi:hypothetical protein